MGFLRKVYEAIQQIGSILGLSYQGNNVAEPLRAIYAFSEAIKDGAQSQLESIAKEIQAEAGMLGVQSPQTASFADIAPALSSLNSELQNDIDSGFQSANTIAQLFLTSYSADGKLSTLVQDLADLASRSEKVRTFLSNVIIPNEFASGVLDGQISVNLLYVNLGVLVNDTSTYCNTRKYGTSSFPYPYWPFYKLPVTAYLGACNCVQANLDTGWKFYGIGGKVVIGPFAVYVFAPGYVTCVAKIVATKIYSYTNKTSVKFSVTMSHAGTSLSTVLAPHTTLTLNRQSGVVSSYDMAKAEIAIATDWTPTGKTLLELILERAGLIQ